MTVVFVDNDAALLRSAALVLESRGHAVRAFADPLAAGEFLARGGPADALVVDYAMPRLSGLELLRRLAGSLPPGCRVVLVSGHAEAIDHREARAAGVEAFVPKPLDFDSLCRAIEGTAASIQEELR